jgi:hypothetical protein
MMPHASLGLRVRNNSLVHWRDMKGAKALEKAHQEALDENAKRDAEKKEVQE